MLKQHRPKYAKNFFLSLSTHSQKEKKKKKVGGKKEYLQPSVTPEYEDEKGIVARTNSSTRISDYC